jgi:hypothetical protein
MYRPGTNVLNDEPLLDENIRQTVMDAWMVEAPARAAANESQPRIQVSVLVTSDISDVVTESSSRDVDRSHYPGTHNGSPRTIRTTKSTAENQ